MAMTAILFSALLAQSAFSMGANPQEVEREDVGYEQLAAGNPEGAIAAIEANRSLESDDPAALINLGNAHARLGHTDQAIKHYRAAIASDVQYDLELADGSWMDSRKAAEIALNDLLKGAAQALRD